MSDEKYRPSFIAMLSSDYPTAVWLSVPLMLWFMWLIVPFLRWRPFTWGVAGLSVLCAALWVRYWFKLQELFANGIVIPGRISNLDMQRTRGTVTVSFHLGDDDYVESVTVARSKATDALAIGDDMRLLVDPLEPESVVLLDLYLRTPRAQRQQRH